MPIDITLLTTTIVSSFLLPYAKLGAEKMIEGMGSEVGKDAAEYAVGIAGTVWQRIQTIFQSPKEQNALELFQDDPEAMQSMVTKLLQSHLENNQPLVQELSDLINAQQPGGTETGATIMHAGVAGILDARGANFAGASGFTLGGVIQNSPQSQRDDQTQES